MGTLLETILWMETDDRMKQMAQAALAEQALDHGMEAEVYKLSSQDESYVLKVWNQSSRSDVASQYRLLQALGE